MAKVFKYHLTQTGPKQCTAQPGRCPYRIDEHFSSTEIGIAKNALEVERKKEQNKATELSNLIGNNTPGNVINFSISERNSHSLRNFTDNIDKSKEDFGFNPNVFKTNTKIRFKNSETGHEQVSIQAVRHTKVLQDPPRLGASWSIISDDPNGYDRAKTQSIEFDINNVREVGIMKAKAYEFIRTAATKAYLNNDLVEEKTEEVFSTIMNSIKVVENEARGSYVASALNMSYFNGRDPNLIETEQDYNNSSFRGKNLAEQLKNKLYSQNVPEVRLRVYDNDSGKSNSWWSIERSNNEWKVTLYNNDKTKEEYNINKPEEAKSIVHNFVKNEMKSKNIESINNKSEYVFNLINDVEKTLKDHKNNLNNIKEIQSNKINNEAIKKAENELYDVAINNDKNNSILNKIFKMLK